MPGSDNISYTPHSFTKFLIDFSSTAVAGVFAKSIVAPLDRIKLILQTRRVLRSKYGELYPFPYKDKKTIRYTFHKIIEKQGTLALWRGNLSNISRSVPAQSLMFGLHKYIIKLLTNDKLEDLSTVNVAQVSMVAGALSSSITLICTYQMYICQSIISSYRGRIEDAKFSSVGGCMRRIYQKTGVRGLYTGFLISQFCVTINRALFFGLYDTFKYFQMSNYNYLSPRLVKLTSAQASSLICSFATYPAETIARRLISEASRKNKTYGGTVISCFRIIFKEEGIKGLFGGSLTNTIRSFGGAIVLVLHEEISARLLKFAEQNNT